MPRQYLTAKFRPDDKRSYTYHNDGDAVQAGDAVKLPAMRGGDGFVRGTVDEIISSEQALALPFETKAILGRVEQEAPAADSDV